MAEPRRERRTITIETEVRFCPVCDRELQGRSDKVYCGEACKQAAHRERHPKQFHEERNGY